MKRRPSRGMSLALLVSAALHAAVVVLVWATASRAAPLPAMRVFEVDLVSPPPQALGEKDPGAAAPPVEETPAEPEPEPTPPEPEPEPAKPEPAPPKKEAPKKPEPAPKKEPSPPRRPTTKPEPAKETPKPPAPKPPSKAAEEPGEGPPRPATGPKPAPSSAGGENLNVHQEGAEFVDPAYLQNIIRQLERRFRPPAGERATAEVFFRVNRSGTVADIRVVRNTGSVRLRLAALEAVEQAGIDKAFGPLPPAYPADQLAVSFTFDPAN